MTTSIDQQFIEYIVKSVVGNPEAVKVERRIDEKGVLLELIVDPEDLGRVIGKRGATAQSLRTLLRSLGTKNDARYNLKIVDTGPPPDRSYRQADDSTRPADDKLTDDSAAQSDMPPDDKTVSEPEEPAEAPSEPSKDKPADDIDMSESEDLPETPSDLSSEASAKEEDH